VKLERLELLVILAQPEKKANMAIKVHPERKVKRATREKKEKVATMAAKVRKENLVGMDSMEPLGRLDIQVFLDHKGQKATRENLVTLSLLKSLDHLVFPEPLEKTVPQVFLVVPDPSAHLAQPEKKALPVKAVQREKTEMMVKMGHQVKMEHPVLWRDLQDHPVLLFMVKMDFPALMVCLERMDVLVNMAKKV
jgi:hypothetical protein